MKKKLSLNHIKKEYCFQSNSGDMFSIQQFENKMVSLFSLSGEFVV